MARLMRMISAVSIAKAASICASTRSGIAIGMSTLFTTGTTSSPASAAA